MENRIMQKIRESFEWFSPEWTVVNSGKNTIRIKGTAMIGDAVSRNNRQYVADELKRSARTWVGKPITINHDDRRIAGNLLWMEYNDKNNCMEYVGDVKVQPYVDMIRNKSTEIRKVSIQADYLHNLCPKCVAIFISPYKPDISIISNAKGRCSSHQYETFICCLLN